MLLQAKAGESHSAKINMNTINNKNSALMCVLKCLVRFQAVSEMTANTLVVSLLYASPHLPSSVGVHEVKYISPPVRGQYDST